MEFKKKRSASISSPPKQMTNLKTLINSSIFDKNLHSGKRLKFALQIDPAIHYVLKHLVLINDKKLDPEELYYSNSQLFDIAKEKRLTKE